MAVYELVLDDFDARHADRFRIAPTVIVDRGLIYVWQECLQRFLNGIKCPIEQSDYTFFLKGILYLLI